MWKIVAINNKTNKVALLKDTGQKLYITIPLEHKSNEEKQAYIKGHTDAYDKVHAPRRNKVAYCLFVLAVIEAMMLLWHVILH